MRVILFISLFCVNSCLLSQNLGDNSILWRISKKHSSEYSYLYGTMHVKDKRVFYTNDSLPAFINACDWFALELHPDSMNAMLFNELNAEDTSSNNLRKIFTEEEYRLVDEKIQKDIGIELGQVKNKNLNYIKMLLSPTKKRSDDYPTFLDGYLLKIAKRTNRNIIGLESIRSQASAFRYLKAPEAIKDQIVEISKETKSENAYDKLVKAYQVENIESIHQMFADQGEESAENILYRRNTVMALTIDSIISTGGSIFAACGAGHLGGSKGVIKLLREMGYVVSPVLSKKRTYLNAEKIPSETGAGWQKIALPSLGVNYVLPGSPMAYKKNIILAESKMYMDVTSGVVYLLLPISITTDISTDKKILFDKVAEGMQNRAPRGTSVAKKYGTHKGYEYCQVSFETKMGYNISSRLYIENNILYDFLVTYPSANEIEKEADYFFSTIDLYKPIAQETYLFRDNDWDFSIDFPGNPSIIRTPGKSGKSTATSISLKSSDNINGVHYIVEAVEAGEGQYYTSDTMLFNNVTSKFKYQDRVIYYRDSSFKFQNFPAKEFVAVFDDNSTCAAWLILKGFKFYSVMAVSTKKNIDAGIHKAIQNSFTFHETATPEFNWYRTPIDSLLSLRLPGPFKLKVNEQDGSFQESQPLYTSYEPVYGVTYFIEKTEESPYYYTLADTLYWKNVENTLVGYDDSLITSAKIEAKNINARQFVIKRKNSSFTEYYNVFNNGKWRYNFFAYIPDVLTTSYLITPLKETRYNGAFKKEFISDTVAFKLLVSDFLSKDTILQDRARRAIYSFKVTDNIFPLLEKEMERPAKDSTEELKDRLVNKLKDIKPDLTMPYLNRKLFINRNDSLYDYNFLSVLVSLKTEESYATVRSFLKSRIYKLSEYSGLFYGMHDSLELAKVFFPEFLAAIHKDTAENEALLYLGNRLLDSSLIHYDLFRTYEYDILKYSYRYLDQKVTEKELIENYFPTDAFDILFKSDNKKMLNELLIKMSHSKNIWARYYSIVYALRIKNEPEIKTINEMVKIPYLRHMLYSELANSRRPDLFPQTFKDQRSLAEGDLFSFLVDEEYIPKEVKFVKEINTKYNGADVYFFIFKVELNEGRGAQFGFTGPYTKNGDLINSADKSNIGGDYIKGQEEIQLFESLYQK